MRLFAKRIARLPRLSIRTLSTASPIARQRRCGLQSFISLVATVVSLTPFEPASAAIPASERAVLVALYNSTNGDGWLRRSNWNGPVGTECTWQGVLCTALDANVAYIRLDSNNLAGSLPATLNQLPSLQEFNVSSNRITGSIPALNGLTALKSFRVEQNQLTGTVPLLTGLTNLEEFAASSNDLTGSFPSIAGLPALQSLRIYSNRLTGNLPELSGSTALRDVRVQDNQFTGLVPRLTGLNGLRNFYGYSNQFTGPIPSLSGLSALLNFDLSNNRLTGAIPELAGLAALQGIYINNNRLTGAIPALTGLTALRDFHVYSNELTGTIPSLAGLGELREFIVRNNQLSGALPAVPAPINGLPTGGAQLCPNQLNVAIDAAWDTATGLMPWSTGCIAARPNQTLTFGAAPALAPGGSGTVTASATPLPNSAIAIEFASLTPAICAVNTATGQVTVQSGAVVGALCTITADKTGDATANSAPQAQQTIVIGAAGSTIPPNERAALAAIYNSTNGAGWTNSTNWNGIPGTECTWYGVFCSAGNTNVTEINLSNNNLIGTIPASINQLLALRSLRLNSNQLSGVIPALTRLTSLQLLRLNSNQLSGPIPSLAGLSALQDVYLYDNALTGTIPSVNGLSSLRLLFAANNQLTGTIPMLVGLTRLQQLDVSNNRLTGAIPSLGQLTALQSFNVAGNQLSGAIPNLSGLTALQILRVENNQLSGALPAVPTPTNSLLPELSMLCPNQLTVSVDAGWDAATPGALWSTGCVSAAINQILTFGPAPTLTVDGSGTVTASAAPLPNSAAPIVFGSVTPAICAVNAASGLVTVQPSASAGNVCTITADKAGDGVANAAPQVRLSIAISAAILANAVAVPSLDFFALLGLSLITLLMGFTCCGLSTVKLRHRP